MRLPWLRRQHGREPIRSGGIDRFLPWILTPLVFLGALSLSAVLVVSAAVQRWSEETVGAVTIVIPGDVAAGLPDGAVTDIVATLAARDAVAEIRALPEDELAALVGPWLGPGLTAADLPLPTLIDLRPRGPGRFPTEALQVELSAIAPGIAVEDHGAWLTPVRSFAGALQATAILAAALIVAGTALTALFAARASMAIQEDVVEILHTMGATDDFIARRFQYRALIQALKAGVLGTALAAAVLWGLSRVAGEGAGLLPPIRLSAYHWAALAIVPLLVAAIATLSARFAILRALARMP